MIGIVVIDDDPLARERVATTLRYKGYHVACAPDGKVGVDLVRDYSPDVVLCDVNMPVMDGYNVLNHLRDDPRTADIPFVFMTARSERDDMRRGMERGADDYLTKPFTSDELVAAVIAQLEKRRTITEKYETTINLLRKNIVYALPHELRTPLTGSMGYAELLHLDADKYTPEQVRDLAAHIMRNNDRLLRVLENFIVYAQIEVLAADPQQVERLRNHVTPHVGQLITARATKVAERHGRQDDLVIDAHDFAARIADEDLGKIVDELVDNAFKFSRPGSPVKVRCRRAAEHFYIAIVDQGRGMSPEQIALIGAYMQFDRVLYEQQGLGLGLIIAKRLTELHRGHLTVRSEIRAGTVMRLDFPTG